MRIRGIAAIAGIVAGLVVVSGGALVVAGVALHTTAGVKAFAEPSPILGPITPAGHPYDQLAILRRQRMSDDVMPALTLDDQTGPTLVAASARLIASTRTGRIWVVVNSLDEVCVVDGENSGGGGSLCSTASPSVGAGRSVAAGGFGDRDEYAVISDGVPATGAVPAGFRQVAPNIWFSRRSTATPAVAKSAPNDPLAFPLEAPYSHFAILRRPQTASGRAPASWMSDEQDDSTTLVPSSLRRVGTYRGTTVWVGVKGDGDVCLRTNDGVLCGADPAALGAGIGDSGDQGQILLVRDSGDSAKDMQKGSVRIGQNVWFDPQS